MLIKYWRFFAVGFAILSALGALLFYGHSKYHEGYKVAEEACEAEKQRTINERLRIRADQDNIIRPDTLEYIKRLREYSA